jgi:hypothetical protein
MYFSYLYKFSDTKVRKLLSVYTGQNHNYITHRYSETTQSYTHNALMHPGLFNLYGTQIHRLVQKQGSKQQNIT